MRLTTLQAAVAEHVRDGDTVALEGFTHLIPFAAGHEIIRQGRRDLALVRMTPDLIYDQMIGMGCARSLTFSWGGNPGVGSVHRFRDAVENGWPNPLVVDERSHADVANAYVAGGAPDVAALAKEVFIIIRQSRRAFVEKLDFITSAGHLEGGDSRKRAGLPGKGPTAVITDLCVLEPDPVSRELTVTSIHPGVDRAQIDAATGWRVRYAEQVATTPIPADATLQVLRDLIERTAKAHGGTTNAE